MATSEDLLVTRDQAPDGFSKMELIIQVSSTMVNFKGTEYLSLEIIMTLPSLCILATSRTTKVIHWTPNSTGEMGTPLLVVSLTIECREKENSPTHMEIRSPVTTIMDKE